MQAGKYTALLMPPAHPAAGMTQLPMLHKRLPRTRASTDQLTRADQLAEPLPYTEYDRVDLLGHGMTWKNEDGTRQVIEEMRPEQDKIISRQRGTISWQEGMISGLGGIIRERPGRPYCQTTTDITVTARRRMAGLRQGGERGRHIDGTAPGPDDGAKADGAKADCGAPTEQLGMMKAMKQVLDKTRRPRMARNSVKNDISEIVHRLLGQEEEALRHELKKIVRDERYDDDRDKARAVPRPPIPIIQPNVGSHADEIDQPIGGVTRYEEGWHSIPCYAGVGYAVLGQHGRRERTVSTALNDVKNVYPDFHQQTLHHPVDAVHQTCRILPTDTTRNLTPRISRRRHAHDVGEHG